MIRIRLPLAIATTAILLGCKKDKGPQVCDHIRTLLADTLDYDVRDENHARCLDELALIRESDLERYRDITSCIVNARTLERVSLCGF